MRRPRKAPIAEPAPQDKAEYQILDEHATEIAGQRIAKDQTTIWLTPEQASFYLAGGAIGTESAKTTKPEAPAAPAADAKANEAPAKVG